MDRPAQLRWANQLRHAADRLEAGNQGEAKVIVDQVSDQMYGAHQEAAAAANAAALAREKVAS